MHNKRSAVPPSEVWRFILSLTKQRFASTQAIRQTEIPALLDGWVTSKHSVTMLCPQKIACPYFFFFFVKTLHA